MGTLIVCSALFLLVGIGLGAYWMRQISLVTIEAMAESREELLKRLMAEFGEDTVERIVGKMIMDLLGENGGKIVKAPLTEDTLRKMEEWKDSEDQFLNDLRDNAERTGRF